MPEQEFITSKKKEILSIRSPIHSMRVIAGLFFSGMAAISMAALPPDQLVRQITKDPANDYHVKWSPDGKRIIFDARWKERPNIFTISLADGKTQRLSPDGTVDFQPSCSLDGSRIAFASLRSGSADIWHMPVGGGPATQLGRRQEGFMTVVDG